MGQWGRLEMGQWGRIQTFDIRRGRLSGEAVENTGGGSYHVTAQGNRRQTLFFDNPNLRRFLGMLDELPERFGLEVQAFVLRKRQWFVEKMKVVLANQRRDDPNEQPPNLT